MNQFWNKLSRSSLKRKILVPLVLVSSSLLLGFGVSVLDTRNQTLLTALESKAEAMATFLQKSGGYFLNNYDMDALRRFSAEAEADSDIERVAFYDGSGKALTGASESSIGTSKNIRTITQAIELDGQTAGRVEVSYTLDRVKSANRSTLWLVGGGILLVEAVLILVVSWLMGRVGRSLGSVSENLTSSSEVLKTGSSDLNESASFLVSAFNEQEAAIQKTMATLTQISATVDASRQEAEKSVRAAEMSETIAMAGRDAVRDLITAMGEISDSNHAIGRQIEESNRKIEQILGIIEEINQKTRIINDIVFQTKLLSFNASVEAARAGEHGRGFSVVAEEVGKLAVTSGNAAREISGMLAGSTARVEEVIQETRAKVSQMVEAGQDKVKHGEELARRCGQALERIVNHSAQVNSVVSDISKAFQEQANGVRDIGVAMRQLDNAASTCMERVEKTAKISVEISSQADYLGGAVSTLKANIQGADASVAA